MAMAAHTHTYYMHAHIIIIRVQVMGNHVFGVWNKVLATQPAPHTLVVGLTFEPVCILLGMLSLSLSLSMVCIHS